MKRAQPQLEQLVEIGVAASAKVHAMIAVRTAGQCAAAIARREDRRAALEALVLELRDRHDEIVRQLEAVS